VGNDVAAGHHHGGVGVGGLFLADGAHEDGVEVVGRGEGDFDLWCVLVRDVYVSIMV
jgi:hypothetical protein